MTTSVATVIDLAELEEDQELRIVLDDAHVFYLKPTPSTTTVESADHTLVDNITITYAQEVADVPMGEIVVLGRTDLEYIEVPALIVPPSGYTLVPRHLAEGAHEAVLRGVGYDMLRRVCAGQITEITFIDAD